MHLLMFLLLEQLQQQTPSTQRGALGQAFLGPRPERLCGSILLLKLPRQQNLQLKVLVGMLEEFCYGHDTINTHP